MKQVTSITNSATLDFVYNGHHLSKATLEFKEVIPLKNSKKSFLSFLKKLKRRNRKAKIFWSN